jgi:hypothetical protein
LIQWQFNDILPKQNKIRTPHNESWYAILWLKWNIIITVYRESERGIASGVAAWEDYHLKVRAASV